MEETYHAGELAVQSRAGVRDRASRIGRGIHSTMPPAAQEFLRQQSMAIVAAPDAAGSVWATLLAGSPGFMRPLDKRTVEIAAFPASGDPLATALSTATPAGLLAIDFATRRRMRINGQARPWAGGLRIRADEVFANCQKYIQVRQLREGERDLGVQRTVLRGSQLTARQRAWIGAADTFFIASAHPHGGADASHRGGMPGFVQIQAESGTVLRFPDYSGNAMFQTLGNIEANPRAGLLFVDFANGSTLQLTGSAEIRWDREDLTAFAGAERVVEFAIEEIVETACASPLRGPLLEYSPHNPRPAQLPEG